MTSSSPSHPRPERNTRWMIALLLGLGVVIAYFDRTNISVAAGPLEKAHHLSKADLGLILSSYLWTYTLMQVPVGALLDRVGVKWLMRVGAFLWSLASYLTAIVSGMGLIILSRLLLGVAEAPAFPGSAKAVGMWFPTDERGLATSSFDAAAKFSSVIGTPIIAWAVTQWGWRAGFWLTGTLTLLYGFLFWFLYEDPDKHPMIDNEERDYIVKGGAQHVSRLEHPLPMLRYLLSRSKVWALGLGFAGYGYAFYFFMNWLPGYFETGLHMSVLKSGFYTAGPWLVATITDVVIGGWLVDHLIRTGRNPTAVRKNLFVLGMLLGLAVLGGALARDPQVAFACFCIALGGLAFVGPIGWSLPGLIAPEGATGMVGAFMNFCNNLAGAVATAVTGFVSFPVAFALAAAMLLMGILAFTLLMGKIEPLPGPGSGSGSGSDGDTSLEVV